MQVRLSFVHALSPLHAGTGQGVGVIDLPIARETATNLPYLPGSSLRGPLRHALAEQAGRSAIFGDHTGNGTTPGVVHFSDQRLLLLPIRSVAGIFAWVTSPYVLRRFARDVQDAGLSMSLKVPHPQEQVVAIGKASVLKVKEQKGEQVYLEDVDLTPDVDMAADTDAWAEWLGATLSTLTLDGLTARLAIVPDDVLSFFLTTATEVVARIRLEEGTKTVATGALWYEEALPAETVLAGMVLHTEGKRDANTDFDTLLGLVNRPLHLGGNTGVGRGLCRVTLLDGGTGV